MENPPKSDETVVELAIEAATNAACAVIQKHLGVTDGGYAAEWWMDAAQRFPGINGESGLAGALTAYLRDQRQAEVNDDGVDGALHYALYVLEQQIGPIPEKAELAIRWIKDILAQRDCANWTYVDLTPDSSGMIRIPARGEGSDRLTDLISVIIRG